MCFEWALPAATLPDLHAMTLGWSKCPFTTCYARVRMYSLELKACVVEEALRHDSSVSLVARVHETVTNLW